MRKKIFNLILGVAICGTSQVFAMEDDQNYFGKGMFHAIPDEEFKALTIPQLSDEEVVAVSRTSKIMHMLCQERLETFKLFLEPSQQYTIKILQIESWMSPKNKMKHGNYYDFIFKLGGKTFKIFESGDNLPDANGVNMLSYIRRYSGVDAVYFSYVPHPLPNFLAVQGNNSFTIYVRGESMVEEMFSGIEGIDDINLR